MSSRSRPSSGGPPGPDQGGPGLSPRALEVIAAFAETMAPGEDGLPAAESEVPVAGSLAELCRRLSSRQVAVLRAGILAFEWAGLRRRFSSLAPAQRTARLERMARSRWGAQRELLMLMKTLYAANYCRDERVRAAVGSEARCAVAGEPPTPAAILGELRARGEGEQCEIAIVGSGAGGAAAATVLAEAGFDVVVIEAGEAMDRDSYPDDPLEATEALYRDSGLTVAEGLPLVPVPVGEAVGGTTVINSGTCFRASGDLLSQWDSRFGIPWASDLDGEFEKAERMLAVRTPPIEAIGRNGQLVAEGAGRLGLAGDVLARNAGGCVQCSSCPQGCRIDAKRGMHVSYLPRAVAAGARIRSGLRASRLLVEGDRVRGLACRRADGGGDFALEATRAVICAGGSLGTPELLLRSGLGGPAVGRNLRLHPSTWVGARFEQPVRGWEGVMQSYGVSEWASQGVMLEATFTPLAYCGQWLPGVGREHQERLRSFQLVGANGVQVRDVVSGGRVGLSRSGRLRISYRLRAAEARKLVFGMARAAEIWFAAGAREVYPQISGNPVIGPADVGRLESRPPAARHLRLEAFHPMGSARIGADPASTVGGPDGRVRGTANLFVADASIFPTSLGVNPMMTVIAAATRISKGIAASLS